MLCCVLLCCVVLLCSGGRSTLNHLGGEPRRDKCNLPTVRGEEGEEDEATWQLPSFTTLLLPPHSSSRHHTTQHTRHRRHSTIRHGNGTIGNDTNRHRYGNDVCLFLRFTSLLLLHHYDGLFCYIGKDTGGQVRTGKDITQTQTQTQMTQTIQTTQTTSTAFGCRLLGYQLPSGTVCCWPPTKPTTELVTTLGLSLHWACHRLRPCHVTTNTDAAKDSRRPSVATALRRPKVIFRCHITAAVTALPLPQLYHSYKHLVTMATINLS